MRQIILSSSFCYCDESERLLFAPSLFLLLPLQIFYRLRNRILNLSPLNLNYAILLWLLGLLLFSSFISQFC